MGASSLLLLCCLAATGDDLKTAMRQNLRTLTKLQPLLASPEAFADPRQARTIAQSLTTLARTRHPLTKAGQAPTTLAIATLFTAAIDRAQVDLARGYLEPARHRVRAVTGLCLSCHARQVSQSDVAETTRLADDLKLHPLERAELLAATRQFDAALAVWRQALREPRRSDAAAFEQDQALRSALAVTVRAQDDAAATQRLLHDALEQPGLSSGAREELSAWSADTQSWQGEHVTALTAEPEALFTRAGELLDAAGVARARFSAEADRIKLLRAAGYLNLALERAPTAAWRGEALYLLGLASVAELDSALWELDGLYFEACVRENPHTALARRCVETLSERTRLSFTGSGGTRLPHDVAVRLATLRELAAR